MSFMAFRRLMRQTLTRGTRLASLLTLSLGLAVILAPADEQDEREVINLKAIGSYASGIFNAGGAEIVAHDAKTQRLFVVNALSATVDVLSIANPALITRVAQIDVKPYGAVANSLAVDKGIVAVAVENAIKTDPGKVVFFSAKDLNVLNVLQVGPLPDMLTFSPDGDWLLIANEGEPNDSYTIDPEGSVSIIQMKGDVAKLKQDDVRTVDFRAFNAGPLPPGIRIFGPGATVSRDMEPEYIAVSPDSKTAYVTLQENNAIAVIDIKRAVVTKLVGLGYKDHSKVEATAKRYNFRASSLPPIGTTLGNQTLFLGGFSGLHFEGTDPVTGALKFITHTDRGPNAEPTGILRPFLLPDFTPRLVRFQLNRGQIDVTQIIPLKLASGTPLTGLSNTALGDSGNTPYNDEVPVNLLGNILPLDPFGADLEGIVIDPRDGTFWMVDEYRPAIYHFSPAGVLLDRFVPVGTAAAAGQPPGTYGTEVLPAVLGQRRQNRGFEGIAYDDGKVYAFMQSPLRNPPTLANSALNQMRNIRVVEFNPTTRITRQFIYVLDNPDLGPEPNTRADKIGDAVSLGFGEFLALERDDDALPDDNPAHIEKKIYRFNLTGATDVTAFTGIVGSTGKTVDQLTVAEMVANGIHPVAKSLHVDLNKAGYNRAQKVEGLAVIDPWTLAVINDNDFGVANITIHPDGTFTLNYVPEPEQLGIIDVRLNGLDASDRDNKINIRQWPVKGLYLPDAIASYKSRLHTYLVTANEGDAREYSGFQEAVRIGSVDLDPVAFPDPAVLKNNANLGRLNITSTLGRNPATGAFEQLFAFGTRSFSIWSETGDLVFDSSDQLEWISAMTYPSNFNASNTSNDFDNRSDGKGPEPEGIAVGMVGPNTYAFIGLERIGGVVMYDISDPHQPVFITYVNGRDFGAAPGTPQAGDLGPEGMLFIDEKDSPTRGPLLVVGNEISGTTTIFEITREKRKKKDRD
jgi:hypothetical protein